MIHIFRKNVIYHSAMVDTEGKETLTVDLLNNFNRLAAKPLAIIYFSDKWAENPNLKFPIDKCMIAYRGGAAPHIRIQNAENDPDGAPGSIGKFSHANISNGIFDTQLTQYAMDVKKYGMPVILEYGTEIDGGWFTWSDEGPTAFKDAFRHIVKLFRNVSVPNVEFSFHCDITNDSKTGDWYPGDDIVDWCGSSIYGVDTGGCLLTLDKYYDKLAALTKKAKLGVFEWGLGDAMDTKNTLEQLPKKYPKIKMIQLWNEKKMKDHPEDLVPDGRIDANMDNLIEYQKGINNPVYVSKYDNHHSK